MNNNNAKGGGVKFGATIPHGELSLSFFLVPSLYFGVFFHIIYYAHVYMSTLVCREPRGVRTDAKLEFFSKCRHFLLLLYVTVAVVLRLPLKNSTALECLFFFSYIFRSPRVYYTFNPRVHYIRRLG